MTSKHYRKGYLLELKSRDELYRMGASLVVRSSGSHTPIDLIAFFPDHKIMVIQVKSSDETRVSKFEQLALQHLKGTYTVKPAIYILKNGKYQFMEV
jgi:Holliday junction resolvase